MPLVWAHAEYLKLCRSLRDGEIFDRPPQTVQRYLVEQTMSAHISWRFNNKVRTMAPGRLLRIETLAPAIVHWSDDNWRTVYDSPTVDTTLGVQLADLQTTSLRSGDRVSLTFYWPEVERWEGVDYLVGVE
jgi:glucoamylase